jgi:peroxiredoxin
LAFGISGSKIEKQMKKNLTLALFIWLGASLLFVGCSSSNRHSANTPAQPGKEADATNASKRGTTIGKLAPDFKLVQTDGSPVSLADLHGQPAMLVFWTAWCPTCKEEAPHINKLAADYEKRGVRVLGINIQDSVARSAEGVKDFGIRYMVARDADASVARRYGVVGTPTIVLLDRKGIVRYFSNALPPDSAARLDALLAENG